MFYKVFLLIFPIFNQIEEFISKIYLEKDNNLFIIFRIFLSKEFSFIFILIIKCRNKSSKKKIILDENDKNDESIFIQLVEAEINNKKKINKIKSIIFLFLLSVLYFGSYMFNYFVIFMGKSISCFVEIQ